MRYDKGDDQLNAWSVTKSVGKKLKKLHLDLPRKYKNKQVLDLKIIIYYVYQIQWVIRVGKKYLPQPCQTVRSCKIMYTQKTHAYHSCKSKLTNNICVYSPQMRVNLKRALKVRVLRYSTGYVCDVPTSYYHLGHAFVANIAFTHKIVLEIS